MDQQNVGSKRAATEVTGKISAKSHEAAEQLKGAVVDQATRVRDQARSAKQSATDRIRGVANQFENVSNALREEDPFTAGLAERASTSIANVARYVNDADARALMRDAESLARRQPAMFFGGAFLLGLVAGRFLKSSAPQRGYSTDRYASAAYRDDSSDWSRRQTRESGFFTPPGPGTENETRLEGATPRLGSERALGTERGLGSERGLGTERGLGSERGLGAERGLGSERSSSTDLNGIERNGTESAGKAARSSRGNPR